MIWNWGQRFHSKELFFILLWAIKERIDIPISPNLKVQPLILDVKWNSCFYSFCCCTCLNKILSRKEILKKFNINHDAFYLNFWRRGSDRNGWRPCTISVICLPTLKILTSSLKSIKGVYLINTPPPKKKIINPKYLTKGAVINNRKFKQDSDNSYTYLKIWCHSDELIQRNNVHKISKKLYVS